MSKRFNFLSSGVLVIAISFFFTLVIGAGASDINMTGEWTMQVTSDSGTGAPVFKLHQDGQKLTGTYNGKFGEAPVTGTIKGNEFNITYEMSGVSVSYAGTTDGKICKGNVDYGMYGKATFTGAR